MATVTTILTRLIVNKYASFGDLLGSISSFQTAAHPTYSTKALSQSQEKSQQGIFVMHPDDLWHHPVESVVGLTSLFAYTLSLRTDDIHCLKMLLTTKVEVRSAHLAWQY